MKDVVKNKGFMWLLAAQAIEQIGDSFTLMTLIAWAMSLKDNGSAAGNVSLLMFWIGVPIIFFGPFAGVFIDRFRKKTVLITAAAGRTVFIFAMAFLSVDLAYGFLMYVCVFGKSLMSQFFIPARSAFVPLLVPEKGLVQANSLATTVTVITQIFTYAAGGIIIAETGVETAFFINVVLYVLTIIVLIFIPEVKEKLNTGHTTARAIFTELAEGVRYMVGHERIMFMARRVTLLMIAVGLFYVALTGRFLEEILAHTGLHMHNIKALGFMQAFLGMGLVAGVVASDKILKAYSEKTLFRFLFPALGGLVAVLFFYRDYYLLLFNAFFAGAAAVIIISAAETAMQKHSPPNLRGRVIASYYILRSAGLVIATTLTGVLAKAVTEARVVLIAGGILIIYGLINAAGALFGPKKRNA
jgi:MFS transporter, DHA3 family, macrolide efflux protein